MTQYSPNSNWAPSQPPAQTPQIGGLPSGYNPGPTSYQSGNSFINPQLQQTMHGIFSNKGAQQNQYPFGPSMGTGQAYNPAFGLGFGDKTQGLGSNNNQIATNVLDVRKGLSSLLSNYQNTAADYLKQFSDAGNQIQGNQVNLGQNFAGPEQLQSALHGGTDYFGQLGLSQGLSNINLQRNAQNQQLSNTLGRSAGNNSLLGVLQSQNSLKSQLAGIPLMNEAQQGTYQRAMGNVDLQNQLQNYQNQTALGQQGSNIQAILSGLGAQQQGLQPTQSLLDLLSNLQGQQRGVSSSESQVGSKNFS